jgi:hypothetical protein
MAANKGPLAIIYTFTASIKEYRNKLYSVICVQKSNLQSKNVVQYDTANVAYMNALCRCCTYSYYPIGVFIDSSARHFGALRAAS